MQTEQTRHSKRGGLSRMWQLRALLAASLIWWRLYSYYIYVAIGAIAAGRTVMRALNQKGQGS